MKRSVITIAVAAGVASATPAFGRERDRPPDCPIMPTTNDIEQSRSGGLSLQVGGFGLGANRARTRGETDVMMRFGSFADWSAAAVLSQACQLNRRLYPNDPRRQRDEFIALRDRLLGQRAGTPPSAAIASPPRPIDNPTSSTSRGSGMTGWTFAQMWQPAATYAFMPRAALSAGLREGSARVDCSVSQTRGVDDCYLLSETPSGYGFGDAVARYLGALRLKPDLLSFAWPERRAQVTIRLATYM
jgi:hypothetical protein